MHLASSTKHVLLALGIGVSFGACGTPAPSTTDMMATTYTWTKVSTEMKSGCAAVAACHGKGTTNVFAYDNTLTPGSDMANWTALMTANLIDKTNPANSTLITVGKGGAYMTNPTHQGTNLSATQATNWTAWITAGATFP